MLDHRPFTSLGGADHGWLKARHHFSFAGYHDPQRMGWGAVRVWNDDEIAPHSGFPPHPHRDMEIITFVRQGAITHEDTLGNRGRTEAGDVQVMSAGFGIQHAEWNEEDIPTHIFQIWVLPAERSGPPRWDSAVFPKSGETGFKTLASGDPARDGGLLIRQDARVLGARVDAGAEVSLDLLRQRHAYLVAARGGVKANGVVLGERDGLALTGEDRLVLNADDAGADVVIVETA
jgi:hypothetical protein